LFDTQVALWEQVEAEGASSAMFFRKYQIQISKPIWAANNLIANDELFD
jgi:hypothetical protein